MRILNAISIGSPFHVASVAMGDNYLYSSGTLCYTKGCEHLHLLDLHKMSHEEIVIDVRKLLEDCIEESREVFSYNFYPIQYADGLLCCRYEHELGGVAANYVIIIDPLNQRILGSLRVPSSSRYWIGITDTLLLLVSFEATAGPGQGRWMLESFDIATGAWSGQRHALSGVVGELHSQSTFGIIGDYFYAVSVDPGELNQATLEWNSTYFVRRHPLKALSQATGCFFWRRRQSEGPINDTWNTLKVERDPESGLPTVFEARMEWLLGEAPCVRTMYRTSIDFPINDPATSLSVLAPRQNDGSVHGRLAGDWSVAELVAKLHGPAVRDPASFHRGDCGRSGLPLNPRNYGLRTYQPLCETFVDVQWEDTAIEGMQCKAMRLQTTSRPHTGAANQTTVWPSLGDMLSRAFTVPRDCADFEGTMDDRSMVIHVPMTGAARHKEPTAIFFISYDPATRTQSLHNYGLSTLRELRARQWPRRHPALKAFDEILQKREETAASNASVSGEDVPGVDRQEPAGWARTELSSFGYSGVFERNVSL